jgi:hypothetical protein
MANESRHRVWLFAWPAWLALVALPTTAAAIQWQRGIGRDPDMTGVVELILFFVAVSMIPMAIAAFGVIAPLAIAVDRTARGRTSRLANVTLGGVLGVLGFAVFLTGTLLWGVAMGWPQPESIGAILSRLSRVMHDPVIATGVVGFVVAGVFVGLGLRFRDMPPRSASLHTPQMM